MNQPFLVRARLDSTLRIATVQLDGDSLYLFPEFRPSRARWVLPTAALYCVVAAVGALWFGYGLLDLTLDAAVIGLSAALFLRGLRQDNAAIRALSAGSFGDLDDRLASNPAARSFRLADLEVERDGHRLSIRSFTDDRVTFEDLSPSERGRIVEAIDRARATGSDRTGGVRAWEAPRVPSPASRAGTAGS